MDIEIFRDDLTENTRKSILKNLDMTESEFRNEIMAQYDCNIEYDAIANGMLPVK